MTESKRHRALALIAAGLTVREAAARIKVGKTALYQSLRNTQSADGND